MAKVTYVHVRSECLRVWNVIFGQVLLCLSTHPQCAPLNKGMGRRKVDLAPLRADAMIRAYVCGLRCMFMMQMYASLRPKRNSDLGVMWSLKP